MVVVYACWNKLAFFSLSFLLSVSLPHPLPLSLSLSLSLFLQYNGCNRKIHSLCMPLFVVKYLWAVLCNKDLHLASHKTEARRRDCVQTNKTHDSRQKYELMLLVRINAEKPTYKNKKTKAHQRDLVQLVETNGLSTLRLRLIQVQPGFCLTRFMQIEPRLWASAYTCNIQDIVHPQLSEYSIIWSLDYLNTALVWLRMCSSHVVAIN